MENSKKWYNSKTIIWGIVSIIAMVAMVSDIDLDTWAITETVTAIFGAIGAVMTVVGRIKAQKTIK